ncbi:MAG: hypothetical protein LBH48_05505 [Bifidobacteriaceae bacterium]|jgi:hypothetical protein|nr:hypothetical protein [Bifidobacteriaceae bacterium]
MTAPTTSQPVTKLKRRRRIPRAAIVLGAVVVVLVVLALVALAVGARRAAMPEPEPSTRTAQVERTSLIAGMVLTGTLGYGDPQDLGGAGGVVTKLPEAGATVSAGEVLMEVDGRPVFMLEGAIPLWREIGPQTVGPDVVALRSALIALGIDAGAASDGAYDGALSAAIADLYDRSGYEPPAALAVTGETYAAAQDAVKGADRAYADAQLALTTAKEQRPSKVDIMSADAAVDSAERALEAAKTGDGGEAVAAAQESLKLAKAQREELLAPRDTTAEQAALAEALAGLAKAQGDMASVPEGDAEARSAAQEGLSVAESAVTAARNALDAASKGPSELELLQANTQVDQATRALNAAKRGDMGAALREAKESLRMVRAQRKALDEPADTAAQELAVTSAREDLAAAREALAEAGLNVVGPKDILLVAGQTIRIDQVKAKLGLAAEGAIVSWTQTVLHGRVDLTEAQRSRVSTGSPVTVTLPSGSELEGVVGEITNATTNPETFEMIPARARIDIEDQAALADIGLATITVSLIEDEAEDTLVVPVTALMALAEGGYCVELADGRLVPVEVGLIADTRAEVSSSELSEGQEVVVP